MDFGLNSREDRLSAHEVGGGAMDIGPLGRLWLHLGNGPLL
jgi:hypothetical protein